MNIAREDEVLAVLNAIREGQVAQIDLGNQAIKLAKQDNAARDELVIRLHEDWKTFATQQYEKATRRSRMQMRVYGLMMAMLGALVALSWLNAFHHG